MPECRLIKDEADHAVEQVLDLVLVVDGPERKTVWSSASLFSASTASRRIREAAQAIVSGSCRRAGAAIQLSCVRTAPLTKVALIDVVGVDASLRQQLADARLARSRYPSNPHEHRSSLPRRSRMPPCHQPLSSVSDVPTRALPPARRALIDGSPAPHRGGGAREPETGAEVVRAGGSNRSGAGNGRLGERSVWHRRVGRVVRESDGRTWDHRNVIELGANPAARSGMLSDLNRLSRRGANVIGANPKQDAHYWPIRDAQSLVRADITRYGIPASLCQERFEALGSSGHPSSVVIRSEEIDTDPPELRSRACAAHRYRMALAETIRRGWEDTRE